MVARRLSSRFTIALAAILSLAAPGLATPASAGAAVPDAKAMLKVARPAQPAAQPVRLTLEEVRRDGKPPAMAMSVTADGAGALIIMVQDLTAGATTTLTFAAEPGAGPGPAPLADAPAWVLWLTGHPLDTLLSDKGVDTEVTSLGHRGRRVLWVLGAGPRDTAVPQLQFERATGRLAAAIDVRGSGDTLTATAVELGYADETSALPVSVVVTDGDVVTRLAVSRADVTAAPPEGSSPTAEP